jgi:6-phosphogluconolactonase (cycloisomerase 2 family)
MIGRRLIGLLIAMSLGVILNPEGDREEAAAGRTPAPLLTKAIAEDTPSPETVPRFAYVANSSDNSISIYTVNAATGELRSRGYVFVGNLSSPVSVSVAYETVAGIVTAKFLYVANAGSNNISAYQINPSNGSLTSVGSPFPAGRSPSSVTVDPTGRFVYVANSADDDVWGYMINAATGVLRQIGTVAAGSSPQSVTVDPTGRFLYVANKGSGNVSAYNINPTTGALTAISSSPFMAESAPQSVTVDPTGRFVYVANQGSNDISAYRINAGALTLISGSPFPACPALVTCDPEAVTVDPSGKFVYVANSSSSNVWAYAITSTGTSAGALSLIGGSPFAAPAGPKAVVVDPSGKFVYVAAFGSHTAGAYSLNSAGALAPLAPGRFRTRLGPASIALTAGSAAVTYTPQFAYVANQTTDNVSALSVSATGTLLDSVPGSPFSFPQPFTDPYAATVDPSSQFLYVVGSGSNEVWGFNIASSDGALRSVAGTPFATGLEPRSVAVDPSGRFAYVANFGDSTVSAYVITPTGTTAGALLDQISGSPFSSAPSPQAVTVDPSGRFAFVAGFGGISAYNIDPGTGVLTLISGSPFGSGPFFAVTVDPSGNFAFASNFLNTSLSVFLISTGGALTEIAGSPFASGLIPTSVAVDPSGKFCYTANFGEDDVSAYRVSFPSGELSEIAGSPFGAGLDPVGVTVDPSGRFVYVAKSGAGNVSGYEINPATGSLSFVPRSPFATGTGPRSVAISGSIH